MGATCADRPLFLLEDQGRALPVADSSWLGNGLRLIAAESGHPARPF